MLKCKLFQNKYIHIFLNIRTTAPGIEEKEWGSPIGGTVSQMAVNWESDLVVSPPEGGRRCLTVGTAQAGPPVSRLRIREIIIDGKGKTQNQTGAFPSESVES